MKKTIALTLCMLLVPFTAMGMQTIDEAQLDEVTGQSGVSIAVDDVQVYQHTDGLFYVDTSADGAAVGYTDMESMTYVNAILADSDSGQLYSPGTNLKGNYEETYDFTNYDSTNQEYTNAGGDAFISSPLTIDVSNSLGVMGSFKSINDNLTNKYSTTGVQIGLPTVEVYTSAQEMTVAFVDSKDPIADIASAETMGTIYTGADTMALLSGQVEIAAGGVQGQGFTGVSIAVDNVKLYQHTDGVWFADEDGISEDDDGAAVGYDTMHSMTTIDALAGGNYQSESDDVYTYEGKPLTIDVTDSLAVLTEAAVNAGSDPSAGELSGVAGVRIGLPTVEIVEEASALNIAVNTSATDPINSGQMFSFGEIHTGSSTTAVLDGHVEIAPNAAKTAFAEQR